MNKKNPAGKCDGKKNILQSIEKGKKFPAQQVARKKEFSRINIHLKFLHFTVVFRWSKHR